MFGFFQLPWWGYVIVTLVLTQITILGVTLYLHRCQAHRSLDLHPIVSHFFRFWLWLTTGQVTKAWAAIHRKHHAKVETAEDPHSPQTQGIRTVLLEGAELYRKESKNQETLDRYGTGTPDDWIERNLYSSHSALGIALMLIINLCLFGGIGLTIWAVQMAWIPFFAAGIINGVGHYFGYRNFETPDAARNLLPIAFFIGGEELHNNHHAYATSAKFSAKWWEVDIGWGVICILQFLGLARAKRTIPQLKQLPNKETVDADTVKAIITHRLQVMSRYARDVILPALKAEKSQASLSGKILLNKAKTLLVRDISILKSNQQSALSSLLERFQLLKTVYQYRLSLQNIWLRKTATQQELMESLHEWCKQAEATGIEVLARFSNALKSYVPGTL